MRVFGLTGNIGSGKSTVAAMFREAGVPVLDADRISREVTALGSPAFREVVREFGPGVLGPDGGIDRGRLAGIVFSDPSRRVGLERITHPRGRWRASTTWTSLSPPRRASSSHPAWGPTRRPSLSTHSP